MAARMDRVSARALVDAGYMPLADYVAMFKDEEADAPARPELQVSASFAVYPRRSIYRTTSLYVRLSTSTPPRKQAG